MGLSSDGKEAGKDGKDNSKDGGWDGSSVKFQESAVFADSEKVFIF